MANEKYVDISKLITDHFEPQKNKIMSKIKFRDTILHLNENINAYFVRLKTAAAACEFTAPDDEILLQLIQGCYDKRAKIKATQETITLGDMLKFMRTIEATNEASAPNYKINKVLAN